MAAADHVGDHTRPAGLVGGTEAGRVVAVEVLAEDEVVLPRRIVLQPLDPAEAGPPAVGAGEEDRDQPVLQVSRDGVQRQPAPRAGRVLERELAAEEPVVALKAADDQVVEGEPERSRQFEFPPNMGVVDSAGS
jgi:hypothetical protein